MDDTALAIDALKAQVIELEDRVERLSRALDRAVELIGLTGDTLGHHLRALAADQSVLARRLGAIARSD
jgi:DNA-binding transcriptional ArsR family regulator